MLVYAGSSLSLKHTHTQPSPVPPSALIVLISHSCSLRLSRLFFSSFITFTNQFNFSTKNSFLFLYFITSFFAIIAKMKTIVSYAFHQGLCFFFPPKWMGAKRCNAVNVNPDWGLYSVDHEKNVCIKHKKRQ